VLKLAEARVHQGTRRRDGAQRHSLLPRLLVRFSVVLSRITLELAPKRKGKPIHSFLVPRPLLPALVRHELRPFRIFVKYPRLLTRESFVKHAFNRKDRLSKFVDPSELK
jgi:hypothetical protein